MVSAEIPQSPGTSVKIAPAEFGEPHRTLEHCVGWLGVYVLLGTAPLPRFGAGQYVGASHLGGSLFSDR